jgi:glycine cleavage system aminomethyltransferase T
MSQKEHRSLQDLLDSTPNLVDYFHNDTVSAHVYRSGFNPVPQEFTNWRDEQRAWRETALLFHFSYHMPESFIRGPDAKKLLSYLGINSLEKLKPMQARQYFCCNHDGQIIGECILQLLEDGTYELISGMFLQNWVQYHAETGGYDVTVERDTPTTKNLNARTLFRYQIDGPNAWHIFADAVDGDPVEVPFFHLSKVKIAGCEVHVLHHGMKGHPGMELSGPFVDGEKVKARLLAAGEKWGLAQAGAKAQSSTLGETGWIGYPVPAIYTDPRLADYRKWLPADGWEARCQLGGSLVLPNIEDYYVTPWDLGVEKRIKFDHDFIGREALEKMAQRTDHRRKVTLMWNDEDVLKIQASLLQPGIPFKYLDLPRASYAPQQNDAVHNVGGERIGFSVAASYTVAEARVLSVAVVEPAYAAPGTEVVLTWGEPNGGSRKKGVEKHRQTTVRAVVAPAPFTTASSEHKALGRSPSIWPKS